MTVAIKICGFTRAEDIETATKCGVDAIGLVLASDAHIPLSDQEILQLLEYIPQPSIQAIAVVGVTTPERAQEILDMGFDWLQVVVQVGQVFPQKLVEKIIPVFFDGEDVEKRISQWCSVSASDASVSANPFQCLTLDGPAGGGKGIAADRSRAANIAQKYPLMLAGGLRDTNVGEAIARVHPVAVDVSSGVESAPGIKDATKMKAFVLAARKTHLE